MLDIVYVLDGSSPISDENFKAMKAFTNASINSYKVSDKHARIGLVEYGNDVQVASSLLNPDKSKTLLALDAMRPSGGAHNFVNAIQLVNRNLLQPHSRKDATKQLVVFTSGLIETDNIDRFESSAKQLNRSGIELVIVRMGSGPATRDLVTTGNRYGRVFTVSSRSDLPSLLPEVLSTSGLGKGN